MAGVTDRPFRQLCKRLGAGYAVSEMVSSRPELRDSRKTRRSRSDGDVRVGSGLQRQLTTVDLRVLQGKLSELSLSLTGPGEVLSVSGEPVLGWSVRQDGAVRRLDVKLSRPIEGSGRIVIEAQSALGGFPVRAEALRMAPVGSLRHSGFLRVANEGAVRIEVADARLRALIKRGEQRVIPEPQPRDFGFPVAGGGELVHQHDEPGPGRARRCRRPCRDRGWCARRAARA